MSKGHVKQGEGLLTRDDRSAGGKLLEIPTSTCQHCNRVVILNKERKRNRAVCPRCFGYNCDECHEVYRFTQVCTYIEQSLELALEHPDVVQPFALKKSEADLKLREGEKIYRLGGI